MRKPDFFIVGAPKCGTTSLYGWLRQHPEIFMSPSKEPRFFGSDLDSGSYRDGLFFMRDQAKYMSLFESAGDAKRVGEGSTTYLYSETAAKNIKDFCDFASIIIMLRNPVDMLYSYHSERYYHGNEDISDFKEALSAEVERRKGLRYPKNAANLKGLFYRDVVRFSVQVKRYLETFGPENVHIILFDDLKLHPMVVYEQTLNFLGVDPTFKPKLRISNPNKEVRSVLLKTILQNHSSSLHNFVRHIIPDSRRHRLARYMARLNRKHVPRPPLDKEFARQLSQEFEPEVEALSKILGRDLSHWSI